MRYLIALIFSLSAFSASAQKLELGINGGTTYNRIEANGKDHFHYNGNVKAAYILLGGFEAGITVAVFATSYYDYGSPHDPGFPGLDYTLDANFLSVKTYGNYRLKFSKMIVYGGVSTGYVTPLVGNLSLIRETTPYDGYSLGAQAGITYYITRHIGINAELIADHIHLGANRNVDFNPSASKNALSEWIFPATIGIRIAL